MKFFSFKQAFSLLVLLLGFLVWKGWGAPPVATLALPPESVEAEESAGDTRAAAKAPSSPLDAAPPGAPQNFAEAKREGLKLYSDHLRTFYCACPFDALRQIDASSCGYQPRRRNARALRIEWEHLVPAHRFGSALPCWDGVGCIGERGRRCCGHVDATFRRMEADLHNLVPELGELNAARSNFDFDEIEGEARDFGACDFEVDGARKKVEVDPRLRGDIARAYLYMAERYGVVLEPLEKQRFLRWHRDDPPDAWERERNRRIRALQGTGNPYVERDAPRLSPRGGRAAARGRAGH